MQMRDSLKKGIYSDPESHAYAAALLAGMGVPCGLEASPVRPKGEQN